MGRVELDPGLFVFPSSGCQLIATVECIHIHYTTELGKLHSLQLMR